MVAEYQVILVKGMLTISLKRVTASQSRSTGEECQRHLTLIAVPQVRPTVKAPPEVASFNEEDYASLCGPARHHRKSYYLCFLITELS